MYVSIKSLGKLDTLARENGKNTEDGWGHSPQASDWRPSLPTRRLPRRPWKRR
ncbi:MAG: hypothetical protein JO202_10540 [Ktedonobacteraceae bacterium]|nr:hypothetical protein [Ktedonobacteraceae bacterium]